MTEAPYFSRAVRVLRARLDDLTTDLSDLTLSEIASVQEEVERIRSAIVLLELSDGNDDTEQRARTHRRNYEALVGALAEVTEADEGIARSIGAQANSGSAGGLHLLRTLRYEIRPGVGWQHARDPATVERALRQGGRRRLSRESLRPWPVPEVKPSPDARRPAPPAAVASEVQLHLRVLQSLPSESAHLMRGYEAGNLTEIDVVGRQCILRFVHPELHRQVVGDGRDWLADSPYYGELREDGRESALTTLLVRLNEEAVRTIDRAWCEGPEERTTQPTLHTISWSEYHAGVHSLRDVVGWTALERLRETHGVFPTVTEDHFQFTYPPLPYSIEDLRDQGGLYGVHQTVTFEHPALKGWQPPPEESVTPAQLLRAIYREFDK